MLILGPIHSWYYNSIVGLMMTILVRSAKIQELLHWGSMGPGLPRNWKIYFKDITFIGHIASLPEKCRSKNEQGVLLASGPKGALNPRI